MTLDIFVPAIGQYENIGDIILRRQLLRWLRPLGRLHVFLGKSPEGYAEGLELTSADVCYSSFSAWYRTGLASAVAGRAAYFFKPGEIQLSLAGLKEHVSMVPLLALIRLRGGRVARIGSGARNFAFWPKLCMAPSLALAGTTWWRDERTARYLGHGGVMPDLAFGEGDATEDALRPADRDLLVVSMRGDRPFVSAAWLEGVRQFAREHQLKVVAVTQVLRDSQTSRQLADELGGECVDWDGRAHHVKEEELRQVYRRTRMAISDRLHVLVAAYTNGAVPFALQSDRSDKIARHFAVVGVGDVAATVGDMQADEVAARLSKALAAGPAAMQALPQARAFLERVRVETTAWVRS